MYLYVREVDGLGAHDGEQAQGGRHQQVKLATPTLVLHKKKKQE